MAEPRIETIKKNLLREFYKKSIRNSIIILDKKLSDEEKKEGLEIADFSYSRLTSWSVAGLNNPEITYCYVRYYGKNRFSIGDFIDTDRYKFLKIKELFSELDKDELWKVVKGLEKILRKREKIK